MSEQSMPNSIQVQAQVHSYDTPDDGSIVGIDHTPTNETVESLDQFTSLPRNSSFKIGRSFLTSNRPYLHSNGGANKALGPPVFPPDKKSPMSPPQSGNEPPKVSTLPSRSTSVASSFRSKSMTYATIPSEREYSPAMSSLNHSYETLNMSDVMDEPPALPLVQQRKPSRPAPPVPVKEQFESSKEKLFYSNKEQKKSLIPMNKRNLRHRKIHSLRRQIQIKEKMLEESILNQEQLLRELDMYQEIAVAKGPMYEHLNRKMDHCQDNIETLSDEIQRLQAFLADEELKLEEDSVEETRRRAEEELMKKQLETQRQEERKRKRDAKIKKNQEQRDNVIAELIQTEIEFCRDLRLTWQAFALDTPDILESRSIDVATLFGNLKEIIEVSENFSDTLKREVTDKSCPSDRIVGTCFLSHADKMKKAYTEYCVNNDKAEQLLEKYEVIPDIQKTLQKGVETLQSQVSCFNIGSILIKPVQRILKYPLMLNELIKCTEEDHNDREDLQKAVTIMADVASFINESKRRKDIVDKYKNVEDKTLTRKISKLNMHSINKKSSRFGQKFLNTIGIDPMTRDYNFDELERRFTSLSRSVQLFAVDSQRFRENLHEVALSQFNIAENVADLYKDKVHMREVERFRSAHRNIISTYWNQYNEMLESRVVKPLQGLLETFQRPVRLIQKRQDKHLDYSASMQKSEKNKDPMKAKSFRDEMDECKTDYEALNGQLVEELPKLLDIATKIYSKCVIEFIMLKKLFVGRVTKELLSLMDSPLLASTNGDIMEVFLVKHSLVCKQIGRFSFSSKTFKNEDKEKVRQVHSVGEHSFGQHSVKPQTPNIRTFLRGKYAAVKIFQAQEMYIPKDQLDIGVTPGDLVGVIQQKDPMGNTERWFVDNGTNQGFINSRVLVAIGETNIKNEDSKNASEKDANLSKQVVNKPVEVHAYDEVAEDELEDTVEESEAKSQVLPVRKAPPVPPQPPKVSEKVEATSKLTQQNDENAIEILSEVEVTAESHPEESVREEAKTVIQEKNENETEKDNQSDEAIGEETSNPEVEQDKERAEQEPAPCQEVNGTRRINHGYEEIPPSEGNSEPSQDLSPIYEEIKGGSRSTVSSNSSSSGSSHSSGPRGKFHYCQYNFEATESTMISLKRGQVVRVIQVTSGEWWYVEDRNGVRGYVPYSYLKLYPNNPGEILK